MKKYPKFLFIDLYHYVKKYINKSLTASVKGTIIARKQLFRDLKKIRKDIFLELGTNHPELTLRLFYGLRKKYDITLILCILDKRTCLKRATIRSATNTQRVIPRKLVLEKLKRKFPKEFIDAADSVGLRYIRLKMKEPARVRLKKIGEIIDKE